MDDLDKDAIRARCDRSVSYEAPLRSRPERRLAELAASTPPDLMPDHYGEGAIVADFERDMATLLGKEAAAFMPSGTMAQQIALRIWCERLRIRVVAFHPRCHLEIHEERGYERLHGLSARLVGAPSRLLTLADLEQIAEPLAALLLELPQRDLGGVLPSWEDLSATVAWAKERGIALHLDGARLWETKPFYGREYAEIAGLFDSVYVSLYKGLGGIAGCVLAGPADFIAEARVWQRRHGGTLVHVYPYVLAARAGLAARLGRMGEFRDRAIAIARRLAAIPGVLILPDPPQTNMMHVVLRGDPDRLEQAALAVSADTGVWLFGRPAPTDIPAYQRVEIAVNAGAMDIDTEEVGRLFEAVLARLP